MQDIEINGVKYIPETSKDSPIKIVVLQRGWVMIGYWHREDSDCKLTQASVIRTWGSEKGLGELICGPLPKTKLDPAGTVNFDYLTVVCTIDCEGAAWQTVL